MLVTVVNQKQIVDIQNGVIFGLTQKKRQEKQKAANMTFQDAGNHFITKKKEIK